MKYQSIVASNKQPSTSNLWLDNSDPNHLSLRYFNDATWTDVTISSISKLGYVFGGEPTGDIPTDGRVYYLVNNGTYFGVTVPSDSLTAILIEDGEVTSFEIAQLGSAGGEGISAYATLAELPAVGANSNLYHVYNDGENTGVYYWDNTNGYVLFDGNDSDFESRVSAIESNYVKHTAARTSGTAAQLQDEDGNAIDPYTSAANVDTSEEGVNVDAALAARPKQSSLFVQWPDFQVHNSPDDFAGRTAQAGFKAGYQQPTFTHNGNRWVQNYGKEYIGITDLQQGINIGNVFKEPVIRNKSFVGYFSGSGNSSDSNRISFIGNDSSTTGQLRLELNVTSPKDYFVVVYQGLSKSFIYVPEELKTESKTLGVSFDNEGVGHLFYNGIFIDTFTYGTNNVLDDTYIFSIGSGRRNTTAISRQLQAFNFYADEAFHKLAHNGGMPWEYQLEEGYYTASTKLYNTTDGAKGETGDSTIDIVSDDAFNINVVNSAYALMSWRQLFDVTKKYRVTFDVVSTVEDAGVRIQNISGDLLAPQITVGTTQVTFDAIIDVPVGNYIRINRGAGLSVTDYTLSITNLVIEEANVTHEYLPQNMELGMLVNTGTTGSENDKSLVDANNNPVASVSVESALVEFKKGVGLNKVFTTPYPNAAPAWGELFATSPNPVGGAPLTYIATDNFTPSDWVQQQRDIFTAILSPSGADIDVKQIPISEDFTLVYMGGDSVGGSSGQTTLLASLLGEDTFRVSVYTGGNIRLYINGSSYLYPYTNNAVVVVSKIGLRFRVWVDEVLFKDVTMTTSNTGLQASIHSGDIPTRCFFWQLQNFGCDEVGARDSYNSGMPHKYALPNYLYQEVIKADYTTRRSYTHASASIVSFEGYDNVIKIDCTNTIAGFYHPGIAKREEKIIVTGKVWIPSSVPAGIAVFRQEDINYNVINGDLSLRDQWVDIKLEIVKPSAQPRILYLLATGLTGNSWYIADYKMVSATVTHEYKQSGITTNVLYNEGTEPNADIKLVSDAGEKLADVTNEEPYEQYLFGSGAPTVDPVAVDQIYYDTDVDGGVYKPKFTTGVGLEWVDIAN